MHIDHAKHMYTKYSFRATVGVLAEGWHDWNALKKLKKIRGKLPKKTNGTHGDQTRKLEAILH
jgi:hypothetical protein